MFQVVVASVVVLGLASAQSTDSEPQRLLEEMSRLQEDYKRCLVEQTVNLGRSNGEGAETILRGVSAKCLPTEQQLRAIYGEMPISKVHAESLMQRDRKLGEDAGIAALLEARARN